MRLPVLPVSTTGRASPRGFPTCLVAVLAAASLAFTSPCAQAQSATAWSFDQVLRQALQSHPAIQGKRSVQAAARADLDGAQWLRFPSLSAEVPTGSQETGGVVRIDQPLWSGGRIDAGIDAAGSRVDAAGAGIEEERLTLSLRVIAAYTEALRQTARVRLSALMPPVGFSTRSSTFGIYAERCRAISESAACASKSSRRRVGE